MYNKLAKIIDHFGMKNQLKKFNEECYELIEAIREYEQEVYCCDECCHHEGCHAFCTEEVRRHIVEEVADVQVLLNQIKMFYIVREEDLIEEMEEKIDRTLNRIKQGYYNKVNK